MPRIKKPQFEEYENCMPDRIPELGETVWVYFGGRPDWIEGKVIGYDKNHVSAGFLIDFAGDFDRYVGTWWWHINTFSRYGGSNSYNKLRMERIPK